VPGYMAMGDKGMADMADMRMMPTPPNTEPMMGGDGPFGSLEMGGMFSVVKVRRDQPAGDYTDPGWFRHPPGTTAYEWTGALPQATQAPPMHGHNTPSNGAQVQVKKPDMGGMHMEH
ncbi:MAG: copper oxidase, partial [Betaproteobacteria bacterium]